MAEKRMFTKKITESDAFLDMPCSSQMLYFHLSMNADDDGFVNNPKKIQRMCGASDDDFKLLLLKMFVLAFESGVIVIKHWKMHNYIQKDRYRPTDYIEEKNTLGLEYNNSYTLDKNKMVVSCALPDNRTRFKPPTLEEVSEYCKERKNGIDPQVFVDFYESKGWIVGKTKMKDWKASVRTWEKNNKNGGNANGRTGRNDKPVEPDLYAENFDQATEY